MTERSTDLLAGVDSIPRHEAERLLASITGLSRSVVVLGVDVSDDHRESFVQAVEARAGGAPLQYLEHSVPFGPATIAVDPRVLIPRPETEYLFELLSRSVSEPATIVDLCTGSGNLAVALAMSFPDARVIATDISDDALRVARENARTNGVTIELLRGDLFEPLPADVVGTVDLLTANPPYLADAEFEALPTDVKLEPRQALVAGPVGDEVVARIGKDAAKWLAPDGVVAVEVSEFHARTVVGCFEGLAVTVAEDLSNRDRFVISRSLVD